MQYTALWLALLLAACVAATCQLGCTGTDSPIPTSTCDVLYDGAKCYLTNIGEVGECMGGQCELPCVDSDDCHLVECLYALCKDGACLFVASTVAESCDNDAGTCSLGECVQ